MKSRFFLQRRETMLLSEGTEATSAGGLSPPISPCRIAANTDSSFILTDHKYAFLAICRRGEPDTHADFEAPKRAVVDADLREGGWDSSGKNKSKIRVPGEKTVRGGLKGVAGSQKSSKRAGPLAEKAQLHARPRNASAGSHARMSLLPRARRVAGVFLFRWALRVPPGDAPSSSSSDELDSTSSDSSPQSGKAAATRSQPPPSTLDLRRRPPDGIQG